MNKKFIWFSFITFLFICAGFIFVYYKDTITSFIDEEVDPRISDVWYFIRYPNPPIRPTQDIPEDWKVFHNTTSNYELRYPPAWNVEFRDSDTVRIFNPQRVSKIDPSQSSEYLTVSTRPPTPCQDLDWVVSTGYLSYRTECVNENGRAIKMDGIAFDEQAKDIEESIIYTFAFASSTEKNFKLNAELGSTVDSKTTVKYSVDLTGGLTNASTSWHLRILCPDGVTAKSKVGGIDMCLTGATIPIDKPYEVIVWNDLGETQEVTTRAILRSSSVNVTHIGYADKVILFKP